MTGKCFPLTNFSNDKQIKKNLKSHFSKITFRETNAALVMLMGALNLQIHWQMAMAFIACVYNLIKNNNLILKNKIKKTHCLAKKKKKAKQINIQ